MALMKTIKKFDKYARRGVKSALKSRYTSKDGKKRTINFSNIASDVMMLKNMLNSEKKRYTLNSFDNSQLLGQLSVNASGHYIQDITPKPLQGSGVEQRNGSSIKINSCMMRAQLQQMSAVSSPISGRVYIVAVKGSPVTTAEAIGEFFEPNAWLAAQNGGVAIYDTHCQRRQDFFKDYKVVASRKFYIKNDNLSGQTMIKDINIPIKFKSYHVKFNGDDPNSTTPAAIASGQLLAIWVADSGNISAGANSTLLGVSQQGFLTGLFVRWDLQYYFYDN